MRLRSALASLALLGTVASSAAPPAARGQLVNPDFERELSGWQHATFAAGTGISAHVPVVRTVDPPLVPQMDAAAAEVSLACVAVGGSAPQPCEEGAPAGEVLAGCVDSTAYARAELHQIVPDVRTTTLRFELAALRHLVHAGAIETASELVVQVVKLDPGLGDNVPLVELEVLPSLVPEVPAPCGTAEQDESLAFASVVLDLAPAGFRRGDTVMVRVVSSLELEVFGCRSLANAWMHLWIDDFAFVEPASDG